MIQLNWNRRKLFSVLMLSIIVLGVVLVVSGVLPFPVTSQSAPSRPNVAKIGALAPEIALKDLSGNTMRLSDLQGKPVHVTFWATWCAPCRAEMPIFEKKYQQYKDSKNLVVLGVRIQDDAGPDVVTKFLRELGVTFPIVNDIDGVATNAYRIRGLPTNVFIDRNGVIQDMILGGPLTEEYIERELEKIF
ncbi:MAG: TlpA family protein disulfide reductase [Chloroflexi bacterium]|nr:TlpA family protein disulfide reductase [Chloroflexota bacterium]